MSYYPESSFAVGPLDPPIKSIHERNLYERVESVFIDLETNAALDLFCGAYSEASTCYRYRFDAVPGNSDDVRRGVEHSQELPLVFQNTLGVGFEVNPFLGKSRGFYDVASAMGTMWASFITHLDPNAGPEQAGWEKWTAEAPRSMVFNETGPFWMESSEPDAARREAWNYINELQQAVFDK
jgi:cholinesterase